MRISTNWGIKLGGMLTAILFAWTQVGCSPSQIEEAPPSTQQVSDVEPLAARHKSGTKAHHESPAGVPAKVTAHHDSPAGVPAKVTTVLKHIDTSHKPPDGYEGGRKFHNEGQGGEQRLPQKDKEGNAISYQEWDVNPKVQGVNRGAERLVTGSDGSAYYTSDHYRTFTKVR
jgi:guanyl-specific ribonuclease Sa